MNVQVNNHVYALLQEVLKKSDARSRSDEVSRALQYFLLRVANTWRSIGTLWANTLDGEGFMVDAGALLRIMFDAYLQAEYIVYDPNVQRERAKDYLDFEIVERYKLSERIPAHDHPISRKFKSSPLRVKGEPALRAEYDQVKARYYVERKKNGNTKRGPKTRNQWYPGTLRDIAKGIKKEAEYDYFVATFHGCVHSSALAVHKGPPISPQYALDWASRFAAHIVRLNVMYNQIEMDESNLMLMEALCIDFADMARS